jgi:hypothetical protein
VLPEIEPHWLERHQGTITAVVGLVVGFLSLLPFELESIVRLVTSAPYIAFFAGLGTHVVIDFIIAHAITREERRRVLLRMPPKAKPTPKPKPKPRAPLPQAIARIRAR